MKKLTILLVALVASMGAIAQIPGADIPPRTDDHFQRNLVVNRIDMGEKINQPMALAQEPSLYATGTYGETQGLIAALFNGLKSGRYLAYSADSLNKSLTYEDVVTVIQDIYGEPPVDPEWEEEPMWEEEENEFFNFEEEGDYNTEGDVAGFGEEFGGNAANGDYEGDFDISAFESVIEFIENRIFDKNRSAQIYDVQYIRLVWVDPGETLPDQNVICFKYSDVLETLEDCQWFNKFNDAEHRNMREIFEERLFNGYVTNVSGRGVRTLEDAAFRQNQMVDFEHHLWSY